MIDGALAPRSLDELVAGVRAAPGPSVLVMLAPDLDPVTHAAMSAAIAPLAVERAPGTRVNAVRIEDGADPAAVEAAARFLAAAPATTGQLLRVSR